MHGKILTTEMLSGGDLLRSSNVFVPVNGTIQAKSQQPVDPVAGFLLVLLFGNKSSGREK